MGEEDPRDSSSPCALRFERRDIAQLLDMLPVMIFIKDLNGRIVYANRATAEAVGHDPETFVGIESNWLLPEDQATAIDAIDREVIKKGEARINIVERFTGSSGERWARTDKVPIRDREGKIIGIAGVAVDVTHLVVGGGDDRDRDTGNPLGVEALREATSREERYIRLNGMLNALLAVSRIIRSERDPERIALLACESLVSKSGYSTACILLDLPKGYRLAGATRCPPNSFVRDVEETEIIQCLREGLEADDVLVIDQPAGLDCRACGERWGIVRRLEHDGRVFGAIGVATSTLPDVDEKNLLAELANDIAASLHGLEYATERRRIEQDLAHFSQTHAALADIAAALLMPADHAEIADKVLDAAKRLTDSPVGLVAYIDAKKGIVIPTLTGEVWERCQMSNKTTVFQSLGGMLGWVLRHRAPILSNDAATDRRSAGTPPGHIPITRLLAVPSLAGGQIKGLIAVANAQREYNERDLDAVKRLSTVYALAIARREWDEAAQETVAELDRSNRELEAFAFVASHDLQEPLRMVASYLGLLERRYKGRLDAEADEFIAYAIDGAKRMQQLIDDLLAYSRVGTKGRPFEPVDLGGVLSTVLTNLAQVIRETGAVVSSDPLPTVMADETQMLQLFQNLLGNALKFRGEEQPRIHVSARSDGDAWVISVKDNGIGIAPEFHERIFGLFQRLHSRREYPGTGIGLAICKKVVERHGGKIWVESEEGKGSTFYFSIPVRDHGAS